MSELDERIDESAERAGYTSAAWWPVDRDVFRAGYLAALKDERERGARLIDSEEYKAMERVLNAAIALRAEIEVFGGNPNRVPVLVRELDAALWPFTSSTSALARIQSARRATEEGKNG